MVDWLLPSAHGTCSTFTLPQRGQRTRFIAYTNYVGRPSTGTNWKRRGWSVS